MFETLSTLASVASYVTYLPLAGSGLGIAALGWGIFKKANRWIVGGIAVAVAGGLIYHLWTTNQLQAEAIANADAARELALEAQALKIQNESLAAVNRLKEEAGRQQLAEIVELRRVDDELRRNLMWANDRSNLLATRLAQAVGSPKGGAEAERLVAAVNRNIACRLNNLGRMGGRCIAGQWRPGR